MGRVGKLLKSTGVLFAAKAATQVVSFVLLPVYTAVLSTAEYGEIDLYTTAAMIVLPFLTLQLEQAVFRYLVGVEDERERASIITNGSVTMCGVTLVAACVFLIVSPLIGFARAPLVAFYYVAQALAAMLLQVSRGFGDNVGYGLGSFLVTVLSLLLNILLVAVMRKSVGGALIATAIANILAFVFLFFRTKLWKYLNFSLVSSGHATKMLRYSLPLVFNQVSSWAVNYSNRLVLLAFLGMGANGVYAVACKFSNALSTVYGTYNLAWTENMVFASNDSDYDTYVSRMTTLTMRGYLALVVAIMTVLPLLFPYFVNEAYWDAYEQVPPLLVSMFFSGMAATIGSIYIAHERTLAVAVTTCVAGVSCVVINLLTVQWLGLWSSSLANAASFGIMFFYRYMKVRDFQVVNIAWKKMIPGITIFAASTLLYYLRASIPSLVLGCAALAYSFRALKKAGVLDAVVSKLKKTQS